MEKLTLLRSLHAKILKSKFAEEVTEQEILCLAELENKLESGQLVELPCKVGDTVYGIDFFIEHSPKKQYVKYSLYEHTIENLEEVLHYSPAILFGWKLCFTDKGEAEARLKELQDKNKPTTASGY